MQKWEYISIGYVGSKGEGTWIGEDPVRTKDQPVEKRLAEMGRQGWELISVVGVATAAFEAFRYDYYFKRPIE